MAETWKDKARDVITAVMRGAFAEGVCREELLRRVDAAYPFGPRKHYPYRAWLEVRRSLLFESMPAGRPISNHAQHPSEARKLRQAGYRDMFEEGRDGLDG